MLNKAKPLLDKKSFNMLYNAMLAPHFFIFVRSSEERAIQLLITKCKLCKIEQPRSLQVPQDMTQVQRLSMHLTGIILKTGITSILPLPCTILWMIMPQITSWIDSMLKILVMIYGDLRTFQSLSQTLILKRDVFHTVVLLPKLLPWTEIKVQRVFIQEIL